MDEELRTTRSDCLFEMRLKTGDPAFVYALLEHKSTPDPRTPLQLLGYMVRIWERYAERDPARLRGLPPIISMVFYHGAPDWNVAPSIFDMIERHEALDALVRSMEYVLRNLGEIDTGRLSGDPAVRAALALMKYVQRTKDLDHELLADVLLDLPDGTNLEAAAMRYIFMVYEIDRPLLENAMRLAYPENWETRMGTIAEVFVQQGEARGMHRGRLEGRQEGRLEGRQAGEAIALTRLLTRRFGALPDLCRSG